MAGRPATVLDTIAAEDGYDLLVVGARGAGLSKVLLGSVASRLAARASVPVLVVGDQARTGRGQRQLRQSTKPTRVPDGGSGGRAGQRPGHRADRHRGGRANWPVVVTLVVVIDPVASVPLFLTLTHQDEPGQRQRAACRLRGRRPDPGPGPRRRGRHSGGGRGGSCPALRGRFRRQALVEGPHGRRILGPGRPHPARSTRPAGPCPLAVLWVGHVRTPQARRAQQTGTAAASRLLAHLPGSARQLRRDDPPIAGVRRGGRAASTKAVRVGEQPDGTASAWRRRHDSNMHRGRVEGGCPLRLGDGGKGQGRVLHRWQDSNRHPPACQACALPLGHGPRLVPLARMVGVEPTAAGVGARRGTMPHPPGVIGGARTRAPGATARCSAC